jgi:hypothetical protein
MGREWKAGGSEWTLQQQQKLFGEPSKATEVETSKPTPFWVSVAVAWQASFKVWYVNFNSPHLTSEERPNGH